MKEEEGFLGSVEVGVARAIKGADCGGCEKGLGLPGYKAGGNRSGQRHCGD